MPEPWEQPGEATIPTKGRCPHALTPASSGWGRLDTPVVCSTGAGAAAQRDVFYAGSIAFPGLQPKWWQGLELFHFETVISPVGPQFSPLQNENIAAEINKTLSRRQEGASGELGMSVRFLELGPGYRMCLVCENSVSCTFMICSVFCMYILLQ